ncbi:unnamed protein product [Caenorhabditis auriculariae]|uniref:Uncharacterized protein n=1 Tax=Caenorhabditis auriculariae TaxID=2777116 RepID=A0A8S1GQK5_9PELO|nr:unnamed protein product [Caenorhabditis auriculariae]
MHAKTGRLKADKHGGAAPCEEKNNVRHPDGICLRGKKNGGVGSPRLLESPAAVFSDVLSFLTLRKAPKQQTKDFFFRLRQMP